MISTGRHEHVWTRDSDRRPECTVCGVYKNTFAAYESDTNNPEPDKDISVYERWCTWYGGEPPEQIDSGELDA